MASKAQVSYDIYCFVERDRGQAGLFPSLEKGDKLKEFGVLWPLGCPELLNMIT